MFLGYPGIAFLSTCFILLSDDIDDQASCYIDKLLEALRVDWNGTVSDGITNLFHSVGCSLQSHHVAIT